MANGNSSSCQSGWTCIVVTQIICYTLIGFVIGLVWGICALHGNCHGYQHSNQGQALWLIILSCVGVWTMASCLVACVITGILYMLYCLISLCFPDPIPNPSLVYALPVASAC